MEGTQGEQGSMYQHVVVQPLFAAFQVRRDMQTTVAFLKTRVKALDEDIWGKLKRVMRYLGNKTSHNYPSSGLSQHHQVVRGCGIFITSRLQGPV